MFQSLRQGAKVYVLDKSTEPVVKIGYVENVTAPRPMYQTYNPAVSFGTNMQTVVDVTIKLGNDKKEFVGLPSNEQIHAYGDYVVSETREAMISEVDALLQNSKTVLSSIDTHKKMVESCEKILKELNPVYAKEQERDTAIDDLTSKVNNMQGVLNRLETLLMNNNHDN